MGDGVRIDKWLWAARFFKTRGQAREAIQGGKVRLSGHRVKPGRQLTINDVLSITRGEEEFVVTVIDLDDHRLSAPLARKKYLEDPQSKKTREESAEERKLSRLAKGERVRRPDKRERRKITRFTRKKG